MEDKEIQSVEVEVFDRVHITLLSLASDTYRRNGGLGFALDKPSVKMSIKNSKRTSVVDFRQHSFSNEDIIKISDWIFDLRKKEKINTEFDVEIHDGDFVAHSGFGSGTAIRLGIAESISLLSSGRAEREDIIFHSMRGATSGIGINTYFDGGYVFDLGRTYGAGAFMSSDDVINGYEPPLVMSRLPMPNWAVGICVPHIQTPSLSIERKLFAEVCPLPFEKCADTTFHALFGVHASILEKNYTGFCAAINSIQETAWKKAEWSLHENKIYEVRDMILESGAECVGLSSLGPGMFFFAKDIEKTVQNANYCLKGKADVISASVRNSGRSIRYA